MINVASKEKIRQGLYIISTPIGNLEDITIRALNIINSVDILACEDKRMTSRLLSRYDIKTQSKISYNDHNAEEMREFIINAMKSGKSVGLVSDSGTPLISDPGIKLVKRVVLEGFDVYPIPGPSSVLASLVVSCLCGTDSEVSNGFTFIGFAPKTKIVDFFEKSGNFCSPIITFLPSRMLRKTIEAAFKVFGDTKICITRELTKMFEEKIYTTTKEFLDSPEREFLGEIVLVISNTKKPKISGNSDYNVSENTKIKDICKILSKVTGKKSSDIYKNIIK
jgi:16S rRNA (cytidine1402-2'-O)-methyltransferase